MLSGWVKIVFVWNLNSKIIVVNKLIIENGLIFFKNDCIVVLFCVELLSVFCVNILVISGSNIYNIIEIINVS